MNICALCDSDGNCPFETPPKFAVWTSDLCSSLVRETPTTLTSPTQVFYTCKFCDFWCLLFAVVPIMICLPTERHFDVSCCTDFLLSPSVFCHAL